MIFPYLMFTPFLPRDCDLPPTLYSLLESIINYDNENPVKIKNLAESGHEYVFDFEYPLSSHVNKSEFEILIINHFLMRRINFDTFTAFKIFLRTKMNEIMPNYNKLFDMLSEWNKFTTGDSVTRTLSEAKTGYNIKAGTENITDSKTISTNEGVQETDISDRRFSDTPQSEIASVQNGSYVSEYNYDTNTISNTKTSTGTETDTNNKTTNERNDNTDNTLINETIARTNGDKIDIYLKFLENRNNIMTMIFKELDSLFYGKI